jgi:hypothetical protein
VRLTEDKETGSLEVGSLAHSMAAKRFEALVGIVGKKKAEEFCHRAGRYYLSEDLAANVEKSGGILGREGELPVLSPIEWPNASVSVEALDGEILSVELPPGTRKSVIRFLNAFGLDGLIRQEPAFAFQILRYFFFATSLKVVIPTRQRD